MRDKIFIALCTMVSVITGNAQNTPIGEKTSSLQVKDPEELKVIYVNKDCFNAFYTMEDYKILLIYQSMILLAIFLLVTLLE